MAVLAISLPTGAWNRLGAFAVALAVLVILARLSIGYLARRVAPALVFVLFIGIFLPFYGDKSGGTIAVGGLSLSKFGLITLATAAVKAVIGMSVIALLSGTTPFHKLTAGFARLHFPRLLIDQIALTHRYLFLLREEFHRMSRARSSRGYRANWLWQAGSIGHMVGTLFLRTLDRGERIYNAMLSRGYHSNITNVGKTELRGSDYFFVGFIIVTAVVIRLVL